MRDACVRRGGATGVDRDGLPENRLPVASPSDEDARCVRREACVRRGGATGPGVADSPTGEFPVTSPPSSNQKLITITKTVIAAATHAHLGSISG